MIRIPDGPRVDPQALPGNDDSFFAGMSGEI
jgi:hypothetical protein